MQANLELLTKEYLMNCEEDTFSLALLQEQLNKVSTDQLISRNNFVGHITASIFVVTKSKKVLLLHHKKLDKLLQPGGHIDASDPTPLAAALRELEEETGLTNKLLMHRALVPGRDLVPFHISTHNIPANPNKKEDSHYHHDFQYLAVVDDELEVKLDLKESNSRHWVEWDDFKKINTFNSQIGKIDRLLSKSPEHFLSCVTTNQNNLSILVVAHILPSMLGPLRFLNNNFNLLGVIPKPKSINKATLTVLEKEGIRFIAANRSDITIDFLYELTENVSGDIVLVDIGGYFSSIATNKRLSKMRIIGIVEDTENGQQKYERLLNNLCVPIYSVARSPLKDNEDYLVGHAVAHATDTLLRHTNKLLAFKKCGVIGYGKVGQGICDYLMNMRIKPVVCEINSERLLRAYNHGCDISKRIDTLLGECDVLFCATGSRVLDIHKFRKVKNGTHIASVTSSDDEFNLDYLSEEYKLANVGDGVTSATNDINNFYLLNDGNAVNFLYNASLGEFIYLVQAEILQAIVDINEQSRNHPRNTIHNVDKLKRDNIAKLWLDEFIA